MFLKLKTTRQNFIKIKNLIAKNCETQLSASPLALKVYNSTMTNIQQERYEWANTHRGHGTSTSTYENYNGVSGDNRIFFSWGSIKTETSVRHGTTGTALAFRPTMVYGCLLYTSPSPRDGLLSRMPSSA